MRLRYCIYILLFLALSCTKEKEVFVSDGEVTSTIPYRAVVQGSQLTRASIDGPFGTGNYIFQEGDRLFVVDTDGNGSQLYGVLTLTGGANTGNGIFDGTLNCVGDFSPTDGTGLSATLVGAGQDEAEAPATPFFTISGDKVSAVNYPDEIPYSANLEDYVKKYSHFTSTSTYGDKHFTLTQQTVFVNCTIEDVPISALNNPEETNVLIKKGDATIRTFTEIPLDSGRYLGDIRFFGIFPAGEDVSSGEIWIEDDSDPLNHCGDFSESLSLQTNHYYSLTRKATNWTGFKIKAGESGATVKFNYYAASDGIQYSLNNGRTWNNYTSFTGIPLLAGEYVCVKGSRTNYKNIGTDQYETPSSKPVFTADNLCYLSGNIMSLLTYDFENVTTIAANAFSGAFSKGNNDVEYININPSEPLVLPATVLGEKCYKNMFRQCTKLTAIPDLPATTVSTDCYRGMFRKCTSLTSVSIVLPATDLAESCYQEMFRDCSKLASVPKNMLPSMNLASACYQQMFSNCIFPEAPDLPATTLATHCYNSMFSGCSQITTAPDLNAETLVNNCYLQMFQSCSKLTNVRCLATSISASNCTKDWVKSVKSSGTFTKALSMTSWTTGNNGIPSNWTVENYPAE